MTRDEHLAWAKERALEYLDDGNLADAVASMGSDLMKHPELAGISFAMMPVALLYLVDMDIEGVERWIRGFR